jgi:hypothetical protein
MSLQSLKRKLQSGGKSIFRIPDCLRLIQKGRIQAGLVRVQRTPRTMATACRHPKVRIVSRHEDSEFVECLECGEIFDSEEFRDMEIEETVGTEDLKDDS